jgi:hypothetical protein
MTACGRDFALWKVRSLYSPTTVLDHSLRKQSSTLSPLTLSQLRKEGRTNILNSEVYNEDDFQKTYCQLKSVLQNIMWCQASLVFINCVHLSSIRLNVRLKADLFAQFGLLFC